MNDLNPSNIVLTLGLVTMLAGLIVNILTIRKLSAPRPPNQDLDKNISVLHSEMSDHERRLASLEQSHEACKAHHMQEVGNLYKRINATAERLSQVIGQLEVALKAGVRK
jgi:hypothetical protein